MSTDDQGPRVDRTPFVALPAPPTVTLWICPACGRDLTGKSVGLEPARERCTVKWHLAEPIAHQYALVLAGQSAAEVERLRDALKLYADPASYEPTTDDRVQIGAEEGRTNG